MTVTSKIRITIGLLLIIFLQSGALWAQCTKDVDCKGDRICVNGACTFPDRVAPGRQETPPSVDQAPPPTPPQVIITENESSSPTPQQQPGQAAYPQTQPTQYGAVPDQRPMQQQEPMQQQPMQQQPMQQPTQQPQQPTQWPMQQQQPMQPTQQPAPPPDEPSPDGPLPYQKGYFSISFAIGAGAYGKYKSKDEYFGDEYSVGTRESALPGLHIAGYGAFGKSFQMGGYFLFYKGTGVTYDGDSEDEDDRHSHIGLGLAMKVGGFKGARTWIGAALDFGFYMEQHKWDADDKETFLGLHLFPRLCIDVYAINKPNLKLSVPIGIGFNAVPFSKMKDSDEDYKITMWDISPMFSVGLAVGK